MSETPFHPDRTRSATEERKRLANYIKGAEMRGHYAIATELIELDSELFDVNETSTEWRELS